MKRPLNRHSPFNILITNDDGFESEGLLTLVKTIKSIENVIVTVVAPTTEKSACGHSLTLTKPLRFVEIEDNFFKLDDGTPSDCVYLATHALYKNKPDLVISGINKGSNMGEDITYSGTASAAMEAVLQGIPAFSISQVCKDKYKSLQIHGYDLACEVAKDITERLLKNEINTGKRKFLNINIPPIKKEDSKGYKITEAGFRLYGNDAHLHRNPRGEEYYWIGIHPLQWKSRNVDIMCDLDAIEQKFVSITPIQLNLTSYDEIENLRHLENEI